MARAQQTGDAKKIADAQAAYNERLAAINMSYQDIVDGKGGKTAGGYSNPYAAQIKNDLMVWLF